MKNYSFFSILLLVTLVLGFTTGCSKDDDQTDKNCTNFSVLDGEITINGTKQKLSIAQFIASSNIYSFQLASVSDDCNEQKLLSITIETATGTKLGGTYQIKDFFDAGINQAYGDIVTQKISPVTQSAVELESGSVKITDLGTKKYTIDVNATDITGGKTTLLLTHQF
ncbi:MAG: hypothetical protein IPJ51_15395 [Saprospiraceae bacterium]|nr:hypothetical protein [Saprospiraceae bacterium]